MKPPTLLLLLLATAFAAQSTAPAQTLPAACGPSSVHFKVKTSGSGSIPAPTAGNATIVVIEDQLQLRPGHVSCFRCASTIRLGMDGQWLTATRGFSHAFLSIPAGDHHFCAAGAGYAIFPPPLDSLMTLHVDAGKTYFLQTRLTLYSDYGVFLLDLSNINADEGLYLTAATTPTTFTLKK